MVSPTPLPCTPFSQYTFLANSPRHQAIRTALPMGPMGHGQHQRQKNRGNKVVVPIMPAAAIIFPTVIALGVAAAFLSSRHCLSWTHSCRTLHPSPSLSGCYSGPPVSQRVDTWNSSQPTVALLLDASLPNRVPDVPFSVVVFGDLCATHLSIPPSPITTWCLAIVILIQAAPNLSQPAPFPHPRPLHFS